MKKVLLTGGSGFVGANLVRKLISEGHDVHLFVRPNYKSWRISDLQNQLHIHEVDLLDSDNIVEHLVKIKPDWIFHLATNGAYSWQNKIQEIVKTNVNGTVNLLEAALMTDFEIFINTGSSSEYGKKDYAPTEMEFLDPNSYYAVSKAFGTHYCRFVGKKMNRPIISLRLYSVYGSYEDPRRFVPTLIRNGLNGKLPSLVDPDIKRDFIFVDDVVALYIHIAETLCALPGSVFNVGTGVQVSIADAVRVARNLMDISEEPNWGTYKKREWDTTEWIANIDHIKAMCNWHPKFSFYDGLAKTVRWYRENPSFLNCN